MPFNHSTRRRSEYWSKCGRRKSDQGCHHVGSGGRKQELQELLQEQQQAGGD